MADADEERGWVGKSDRGSDLKNVGYGSFNRTPPHMVFPATAVLISAPPDLAAPRAAGVYLAVGVELHPL
jgi:hypothetical protein